MSATTGSTAARRRGSMRSRFEVIARTAMPRSASSAVIAPPNIPVAPVTRIIVPSHRLPDRPT